MIGVFDSGLGGLTVLRQLARALPQYSYLYLADSARAPYGGHSRQAITEFSRQAAAWLFGRGCPLVIFACNTASSQALRELQQRWLPTLDANPAAPKRILGVVRPVAEAAAQLTRGRVGVLATRATVESQAYVHELEKLRPKTEVVQQAAPLLVPIIEEGWERRAVSRHILKTYLRPLKSANVDTLILGCTHYPLIADQIATLLGRRTQLIDAGPVAAAKLADYLARHPEVEAQLSRGGEVSFATTDDSTRFGRAAARWWGEPVKAEHVTLA